MLILNGLLILLICAIANAYLMYEANQEIAKCKDVLSLTTVYRDHYRAQRWVFRFAYFGWFIFIVGVVLQIIELVG